MSKIKKSLIVIVGIAVLAFIIRFVSPQANVSLAAEVQKNFTKMTELSFEHATSSNPYDYIDNEYYDNIVNLGVPAVKVIEQNYYNGYYDGLNAYIAGLAIQEITDMNLYECTGEDWETGEQFFYNWNETVNSLPERFEKIINSNEPVEEKISDIEKFGVFGQYFLSSVVNEKASSVEFNGEMIPINDCTAMKAQKIKKLSAEEIAEIEDYLESVPK